jgi:NAD+ kinase
MPPIGTLAMTEKIAITASAHPNAQQALAELAQLYEFVPEDQAQVLVALGGDGFMLETLQRTQHLDLPVYGMNRGTVGFLMNDFDLDALDRRLAEAELAEIHPLHMEATTQSGQIYTALAINEVSLLRMGPQAAKLQISIDGKLRLDHLVADGALVATPAGSTAYNYSAHGPILPIQSEVLALTAMSAFRPRRWRGALLPQSAVVEFHVIEPKKRPVMAEADSRSVPNVTHVKVRSDPSVMHKLLFDPGHGLEERIIAEQFT